MVIDINSIGPSPNSNQRAKDASSGTVSKQGDTSAQPQAAPAHGRGDNVSFSDKAKGLQELESSIKSEPEVNKEKVASIKAALDDGSYSINADKVAQKMLDFDSGVF